jgi:uncharacterized SAM-binding protein YcdF (DUF218 family)
MYFILSKALLFLLSPILWVFTLLIITVVAKNVKRKKHFLISALILLYLIACPLLLTVVSRLWNTKPYPAGNKRHYSCAIVLGGFSSYDKNGNGYFNSSADRFIQGMRLLLTGKAAHLLITGGNGNLNPGSFREGDWTRSQLLQLKVPDSSILIENQSRNTIENAEFSKMVLQKTHLPPPYLLITSDFHMRRALMIFKKQGYNVDAYPCNFTDGGEPVSLGDLIPDSGTIAGWSTYLKEFVGYMVDCFKKS